MASGEANYRKGLRNSVYGLWAGVLDKSDFQNAMTSTIERWLTVAWNEGAAECGIGPEELTVDEHRALLNAIDNELGHLSGYADYIIQNSKANGGKRATVFKRLENWVRRYHDLRNRAKVMACRDKKLEWTLGATEMHCRICNKLHGKVKRASYWEAAGLHPQDPPNDRLDCGGWNCLCELRLTDKPISKGPVPGGRGPVAVPPSVTPPEPEPAVPTGEYMTWDSGEEADAWASDAFGEWENQLTFEETEALGLYAGIGYEDMNAKLRGTEMLGYPSEEIVDAAITSLDSAFAGTAAPDDFTAYRLMDTEHLGDFEVGIQFKDNGFTSTTIDPDYLGGKGVSGHRFEVQIPKETRGGYIEFVRDTGENEFLLDRGTAFEVVHIGEGTTEDPSVIRVISQG